MLGDERKRLFKKILISDLVEPGFGQEIIEVWLHLGKAIIKIVQGAKYLQKPECKGSEETVTITSSPSIPSKYRCQALKIV